MSEGELLTVIEDSDEEEEKSRLETDRSHDDEEVTITSKTELEQVIQSMIEQEIVYELVLL